MKKSIVTSLIVLLWFFPGKKLWGQEFLTLEEAIRIGLDKNYSIQIAENDREVLDENYDYGKYNFLPGIDASAAKSYDVEDFEQQFIEGEPRSGNNAKSSRLSASVDLEWTIFNGLGMFITYEKLDELRKAGELNLRASLEGTIAEISKAYYQIILERKKIEVLENTLELSEKRLEIAKAIFEVGKSSKLEYLAAQVDLNSDISELIAQEELYYNAKVNLNRILGRNIETEFEVTSDIETQRNLDLSLLKKNLLNDNPNLLAVENSKRIASLETREIKAERFPVVDVNAGYVYSNLEARSGFLRTNTSDGYYYGLSATLNIFNGFNINRRIQVAKINEENTELLYQQLETNLLAELNNYYKAYQNSLRLLDLETQNLQLAKENEEIAYERYRLGNSNFLEFREAQRNAVEAESRLIDAAYNTKVAEIELFRLSGNIIR